NETDYVDNENSIDYFDENEMNNFDKNETDDFDIAPLDKFNKNSMNIVESSLHIEIIENIAQLQECSK
ncbi:18334_t:CDS:1, partial [Racocetra persica]